MERRPLSRPQRPRPASGSARVASEASELRFRPEACRCECCQGWGWPFVAGCAHKRAAQQFPPGFVDPAPILAAAAKEIGEANLQCVTFSGTGYAGAVGQAFESGVNIDWPRIDSLANYRRTINYATRTIVEEFDRKPGLEPGVLEVRARLAGRHADPEEPASDLRRQRRPRLAHGRRRRAAGRDVARGRVARPARDLDEPARLHQGGAAARRESEGGVAVGAGRDGTRRPDHGARQGARGVDHVRPLPDRRHRQQVEPDPAHPHDGVRAGARRLQLRARVHRSADVRQRQVPDRLALASGLGRQLRLRERDRGAQRVRRQLPEGRAQQLRRRGDGAGIGARRPADAAGGHRREAGRGRVSARRRAGQQHRDGVQELRRGVRSADQRGAQPGGDRADREADAGQADPLPGELAPALRPHRRHPHLPAHRRHHRHAAEEHHAS